MKKKWKRDCPNPDQNPNCKKEISYSTEYRKIIAEKRNTNCISCALMGIHKGKKRSEEARKRMSESHKGKKHSQETNKKKGRSGKNNSMYRKSVYDIWVKKYGKEEADWRQKEMNIKQSKTNKGQKRTEETRKNIRLAALKRNGISFPNHNPVACGIINEYNKKHGFNFQHAENGGEVCIDGYWPDGVDEERKTIIEIDEKHHFNSDGTYKEKDIRRQRYLEGLGYKFIRVRI